MSLSRETALALLYLHAQVLPSKATAGATSTILMRAASHCRDGELAHVTEVELLNCLRDAAAAQPPFVAGHAARRRSRFARRRITSFSLTDAGMSEARANLVLLSTADREVIRQKFIDDYVAALREKAD